MKSSSYTEDSLIEQPAIALLADLGWQLRTATRRPSARRGTLGRETSSEVVLLSRLRPIMESSTPVCLRCPGAGGRRVATRDRSAMSLVSANREIYHLLKEACASSIATPKASRRLSWCAWWIGSAAGQRFFLASQFWVSGDIYKRRADLVGSSTASRCCSSS